MNTVELRAIVALPDDRELVSTGYYVTESATLAQIREMFANGIDVKDFGRMPVSRVEFSMEEEE